MDIPAIAIQPGLDFLLLELPPRYQPMMPNGIGYVHNVLLKTGVRFQTVDVNVLMYHRYHQSRILGGAPLVAPGGYVMKDDPWDNANTAEWEREDVLDFFWPEIADLLQQIVRNGVKAVGISVHASNRVLAKRFVRELRALAPEVVVVVGGYDCVYPNVGPILFPDFDYMVIFEGELTVGPLVGALARGKRPKDLPGIISRCDTPGRVWEPAPLLADLDSVDYPRYQWADMVLYQTYDRKHLVPITASRGCKWGRCRFCAERFPFRNRAPAKVADEIESMVRRGLHSFSLQRERRQRQSPDVVRPVHGDPSPRHESPACRPAPHPQGKHGGVLPASARGRVHATCGSASTPGPRTRSGCRGRDIPLPRSSRTSATATPRASSRRPTWCWACRARPKKMSTR